MGKKNFPGAMSKYWESILNVLSLFIPARNLWQGAFIFPFYKFRTWCLMSLSDLVHVTVECRESWDSNCAWKYCVAFCHIVFYGSIRISSFWDAAFIPLSDKGYSQHLHIYLVLLWVSNHSNNCDHLFGFKCYLLYLSLGSVGRGFHQNRAGVSHIGSHKGLCGDVSFAFENLIIHFVLAV